MLRMTLKRSGVDTMTLVIEGAEIQLSTALELDGSIYGALRTQGRVAKDFTAISPPTKSSTKC